MKTRRAALLLAVPALLSCADDPIAPDIARHGEPIQTDATLYVAEPVVEGSRSYAFTVVAEFTNQTDRTIYLDRCFPDTPYPIFGVRLIGASDPMDEGSAFDPYWGCVGGSHQFEVLAGQSRTDTLRLRAPNAVDGRTGEILGVLEGRVRLVYGAAFCPNECRDRAPETLRLSNEFEIRIPS